VGVLATLASDQELALLDGALRALDAATFAALFEPLAARERIAPLPDRVARPLYAFGLVDGDARGMVGALRVRRLGGRFYVMELGVGEAEYRQDVWPETDALLDALARAPIGRLLDLGTGAGVIAVEAAARGHRVVATDVYETALVLARFNARLNRQGGAIEFLKGHLFEAARGEQFDRVLTNPHYGRVDDQLRLEVLRAAPAHLAPGGELVLATALEWEEGGPLAIQHVLAPLADAGLTVEVRPLAARTKRDWFARAVADEPIARLTSRHRFAVRVARPAAASAGSLSPSIERPDDADVPVRAFVPLARLWRGGRDAAIVAPADLERLGALCDRLRAAEARFEEPLPRGLLDGCRFGARRCVAERGAAGAILDAGGGVRPCTHGDPIARAEHSLAEVSARLAALDAETQARRGCADCPARDACSRCLFPAAVDEAAYCAFVIARARELPLVERLFETVARLDELAAPEGTLDVKRALDQGPLSDQRVWRARRGGAAVLTWRAGGVARWSRADSTLAAAVDAILDGKTPSPSLRERVDALLR
jgi:2-polyprenyl-3-methyl-5-hydroxy-6-metoxy-1,4-benzoquinol methylase